MKKPARGGLSYHPEMDYIEFKLWIALGIVVLAFLGGLFGFIQPEQEAERDKHPE